MEWYDWLRLAGEIIALIVAWFAGRGQLKRSAARRVDLSTLDTNPNLKPHDVVRVMFPPGRRVFWSRHKGRYT